MAPAAAATTNGAVSPVMSSDEVNLLVYAYLAESSLNHSAFTLYNESRLADFVNDDGSNPSLPTTGHLIRILQKGLLYLQAEAKYRGEDVYSNPPRLIGYNIPDALPLPPLPKKLPPPSPPAVPAQQQQKEQPNGSTAKAQGGKKKQSTSNSSTPAAPAASTSAGPSGTSANSSLKRKEGQLDAGEDEVQSSKASVSSISQNAAKKQKTVPLPPSNSTTKAKSPGAASAASAPAVDQDMADTNDADGSLSKAKKGKGKAVDGQGDSEMADAAPAATPASAPTAPSTTTTGSASSQKGHLAKAVAAAAATAKALPNAFDRPNGKDTTSAPSSKGPSPPNSFSNSSAAQTQVRRSTSPQATKAYVAVKTTRPRSTSPLTTAKSLTGAFSRPLSAGGASSTTTMDASGATASGKPKKEASPRPEPKNIIKKERSIKLRGHLASVTPCTWNPKVENMLATGAADSTMRIWEVPATSDGEEPEPVTCKHASGQRKLEVTSVDWNPEGTLLVTGCADSVARIWTPAGDLHGVLPMHQRQVQCVKWNAKGTFCVTGSQDHSVILWDIEVGKPRQTWTGHGDTVLDVAWLSDDVFASCSIDKNIHVYQVGKANPIYRFKGHDDEVNKIRFDPEQKWLGSCSDDKSVRIWSLRPVKGVLGWKADPVKKEEDDTSSRPEKLHIVLKGHDAEVHTIEWSPRTPAAEEHKILASGAFDHTVRIWDIYSESCLHIINRQEHVIYSIAFQPEKGEYLASASNDGTVCITRVKDRELVHEYQNKDAVYEIAWHPTRNQIAVCGESEVVNVVNFELP